MEIMRWISLFRYCGLNVYRYRGPICYCGCSIYNISIYENYCSDRTIYLINCICIKRKISISYRFMKSPRKINNTWEINSATIFPCYIRLYNRDGSSQSDGNIMKCNPASVNREKKNRCKNSLHHGNDHVLPPFTVLSHYPFHETNDRFGHRFPIRCASGFELVPQIKRNPPQVDRSFTHATSVAHGGGFVKIFLEAA
jgi:hypothetical protein